jgi:hypothetical protein
VISLLCQRANQIQMTLRCLPADDPCRGALSAELGMVRVALHLALCGAS